MKPVLPALLLFLVLQSCDKDPATVIPSPLPMTMQYTDLHNVEVSPGHPKAIDINQDGITDFSFGTLLVGDPVLVRDRVQYYAYSKIGTYYLSDANDQSPVLVKGNEISLQHPGYNWFEISAIVLAEKVITMTQPPFWQGLWKEADHKYLPFQVKKEGLLFHGWIELSFNMFTEKLILHKAAISKIAGVTVKAGV